MGGRPKGSTNKSKVPVSKDIGRLEKIDNILKAAAKDFISDYCNTDDRAERADLKEAAYLLADASASLRVFIL